MKERYGMRNLDVTCCSLIDLIDGKSMGKCRCKNKGKKNVYAYVFQLQATAI